jgi:plasmid stabilization system protein ParE
LKEASFHRAAEAELNEGALFYEEESPGLGLSFVIEVMQAVDWLLDMPKAAPVLEGSIRHKALRRFPYSILYYPTSSGIRIVCLMHQSRRPGYWRGRR